MGLLRALRDVRGNSSGLFKQASLKSKNSKIQAYFSSSKTSALQEGFQAAAATESNIDL
jgi:hypothetical protein